MLHLDQITDGFIENIIKNNQTLPGNPNRTSGAGLRNLVKQLRNAIGQDLAAIAPGAELYRADKIFGKDDQVIYNNGEGIYSAYISLADDNEGVTPGTNEAIWKPIVSVAEALFIEAKQQVALPPGYPVFKANGAADTNITTTTIQNPAGADLIYNPNLPADPYPDETVTYLETGYELTKTLKRITLQIEIQALTHSVVNSPGPHIGIGLKKGGQRNGFIFREEGNNTTLNGYNFGNVMFPFAGISAPYTFQTGDLFTIVIERTSTGMRISVSTQREGTTVSATGWAELNFELTGSTIMIPARGNSRCRYTLSLTYEPQYETLIKEQLDATNGAVTGIDGTLAKVSEDLYALLNNSIIYRLNGTPPPPGGQYVPRVFSVQQAPNAGKFLEVAATSVSLQIDDKNGLKITNNIAASQLTQLDTGIKWPGPGKKVRIEAVFSALTQTVVNAAVTDVNDLDHIMIGSGFGFKFDNSGSTTAVTDDYYVIYRGSGQLASIIEPGVSTAFTSRAADTRPITQPVYAYKTGERVAIEVEFAITTNFRTYKDGFPSPAISNFSKTTALNGNIILAVREGSVGKFKVIISDIIVDEQIEGSTGAVYYVNANTGSDDNQGDNAVTAYKSVNKALSTAILTRKKDITINFLDGISRESLVFDSFIDERITINFGENAKIFGSDAITGWTKTAGYNTIYEVPFTTVIPNWANIAANMVRPIFEYGNPSKAINATERHALQKGLTHRLPYTMITPIAAGANLAATLTSLDALPGKYYSTGTKLYLHASSGSPLTNTFSYENIVRNFNSGSTGAKNNKDAKPTLILNKPYFLFGLRGFTTIGYGVLVRYNGVAGVTNNSGAWVDDTGIILSYKDEAFGSDWDGFNGHYGTPNNADYATADPRTGVTTALYWDAWTHDNNDDGLSHHERHEVSIYGILSEYNGDGGIRAAAGANYRVYDAYCRQNGQLVGLAPDAAGGEGIAAVAAVTDGTTRNGATLVEVYGGICENNRVGIGTNGDPDNVLRAFGTICRNNTTAECYANQGNVIVRNVYVTNPDPNKLKVTLNSGTIQVINDTLLT